MKNIDGILTLELEGRIDSSNANARENSYLEALEGETFNELVLDAQNLSFISSAGLRIILKLRRRYNKMRIINVDADIYDIFDMTGVTEMLPIEKAFRVFDVSGCEVVGEGANGKVYRVDKDTIVKVYKDASSLEDIKRERELSRTAFVLGIPTAIPYDVVRVGDTYGSVFEMLNAKSFAELLREDEGHLEWIAQQIAEVMKLLHATPAPANLPRQSDIARQWLREIHGYFDEEHEKKLCDLVESLPESGMMLHGDLHIKNIMRQGDETLLIDMDTLCVGNPVYELAFIYNAYCGFGICDSGVIERFMGVSARTAYRLLRRIIVLYLGTEDEQKVAKAEEKASVIGLLRVMRRVIRIGEDHTPDGEKLIRTCRDHICRAVDDLDTLELNA